MTRQHRYKGLRKQRRPIKDESYEDGDRWEWEDKPLPKKLLTQAKPKSQPFGSVDAPQPQ